MSECAQHPGRAARVAWVIRPNCGGTRDTPTARVTASVTLVRTFPGRRARRPGEPAGGHVAGGSVTSRPTGQSRNRPLPLLPVRLLLLLVLAVPAAAQPGCPDPLPVEAFAYDAAAPLGYADSLLAVDDGVELRAFSFASPLGGRAHGVLAVPRAAGPHAGILNLTGHPPRPDRARAYAATLARRGAVVALLWAPSAGADGTLGGSPLTFTLADRDGQIAFAVHARRTVDLLAARADVDAGRIGLVGGSYGGTMGLLVAGVEPRLRAVALRVPGGGFVSMLADPDGPGLPDDLPADAFAAWRDAVQPYEPLCYAGRIAAPLLIQWGRTDHLVSAARAAQVTDALRPGADLRWYDAGHALDDVAEAERFAWLDAHLGTAPAE